MQSNTISCHRPVIYPESPFSNPKYKDVKFLCFPNTSGPFQLAWDAVWESCPWIFSCGHFGHDSSCQKPKWPLNRLQGLKHLTHPYAACLCLCRQFKSTHAHVEMLVVALIQVFQWKRLKRLEGSRAPQHPRDDHWNSCLNFDGPDKNSNSTQYPVFPFKDSCPPLNTVKTKTLP